MQCPSCKNTSLKPIKLQENLPARKCQECEGVLIDLLSYRAWRDGTYSEPESTQAAKIEVEDNSKALICSKCSKLMLKFKISGKQQNKVDVCVNCDEAWLDKGEWQLLEALSLQEKLTAIFTEPWQRRIREDEIKFSQQQRYEASLGKEDYSKLIQFKEWIESHPKKDELVRLLMLK